MRKTKSKAKQDTKRLKGPGGVCHISDRGEFTTEDLRDSIVFDRLSERVLGCSNDVA